MTTIRCKFARYREAHGHSGRDERLEENVHLIVRCRDEARGPTVVVHSQWIRRVPEEIACNLFTGSLDRIAETEKAEDQAWKFPDVCSYAGSVLILCHRGHIFGVESALGVRKAMSVHTFPDGPSKPSIGPCA